MKQARTLATIATLLGTGALLLNTSCTPKSKTPAWPQATQGWDQTQRLAWYQGTQGSRMMPWSWASALEVADGQQPFFATDNLETFRFVPLAESSRKLPIGFAIDKQDDSRLSYTKLRWYGGQSSKDEWLGLNCSACHTGKVSYKGESLTIDGAPSLVDFQSFIEGVDAALVATRDDPAKWDRFAAKVLAGHDSPANRDMLKKALGDLITWEQGNARLNKTPLRYGYGRLDAFGHIFNKVAQLAVYQMPPPAPRATPNPADAPVSYPFLWTIYREDKLQWNGIVSAERLKIGKGYLDYGALGRNAGEVIGVFGDVVVKPSSEKLTGFPSSLNITNLDRMETQLRHLEPPKWPASFGALDPAKVEAGRALYASKGCIGCHTIEPAGDTIFKVHMIPLQRDANGVVNRNATDPWMACNAISYTSATGKLQGRPASFFKGKPLEKTEPLATMLATTVIGTLVDGWKQILTTVVDIFFGVEKPPKVFGAADEVSPEERRAGRLDQCFKSNSPLFAYKARPLDGIWATAPYLHNGSVPTLDDLLRPAADRPKSFNVGTREFDPVKVGYRTDAAAPGNSFAFTAEGPGNSNDGHDYNVGKLSDADRAALLEYLKSL